MLLFGQLPDPNSQKDFQQLLSSYQRLPEDFARKMILKAPSKDIMNTLAKSVLALYSFDDNPDDTSMLNVLKQCYSAYCLFSILSRLWLSSFLPLPREPKSVY